MTALEQAGDGVGQERRTDHVPDGMGEASGEAARARRTRSTVDSGQEEGQHRRLRTELRLGRDLPLGRITQTVSAMSPENLACAYEEEDADREERWGCACSILFFQSRKS